MIATGLTGKRIALAVVLALPLIAVGGSSQSPESNGNEVFSSSLQARHIVVRGIEAMGGQSALDSVHDISRVLKGERIDIGQSMAPGTPDTKEALSIRNAMEPKTGRIVEDLTSDVLGGGIAHTVLLAKDPSSVSNVDAVHKTFSAGSLTSTGFARHVPVLYRYPETLLPIALTQTTNLRFLGTKQVEKQRMDVVAYASTNGTMYSLFFNHETGLLAQLSWLLDDATYSLGQDLQRDLIYSDYRSVGGLRTPYRYVVRYGGELLEDLTVTECRINTHPPDSIFELPAGVAPAPPRPRNLIDVTKFTDDIYYVRGPYNSMFVNFDDYVLVIEGPLNDTLTQATLEAIKATAPGKPIRYIVPTHFHHDHIGGLRGFIAEGTTIVTTLGIESEVEKLSVIKRPLRQDPFAGRALVPKFEIFTKKRIFSDDKHRVEIYNIGPNPHAADLVIAYIPAAKTLYEADALDLFPGEIAPGHADTADLANKIQALGLSVEIIIPAHGRQGSIGDLKTAISLMNAK